MAAKGIKCKRVRTKAHTRTICRSTKTGKLVKGGSKLVCPKKWHGKGCRKGGCKVDTLSNGACRVKTHVGGYRLVKKVKSTSPRAKRK